jgi:hypothetical protein
MQIRRSVVEQRRTQIEKQVVHLRDQLAKKSRKDFTTDHRYQIWLKRSHELINELLDESSSLEHPGEYEQLPIAVVADELGLRINQIRSLIKLGEIDGNGPHAHERVSREELARLSELGPHGLLMLSRQSVDQIFREAVKGLRAGDERLVENAYRRMVKRETCIGNYALATEIALKLAWGRYEDADRTIKFILRERLHFRDEISSHLTLYLQGMCFKSQKTKDDTIQRIRHLEQGVVEAVKTGEEAGSLQLTAMYVYTVVQSSVEPIISQHLPLEYRVELFLLLKESIHAALYAEAHSQTSLKSCIFLNAIVQKIPHFWEPLELREELQEDSSQYEDN